MMAFRSDRFIKGIVVVVVAFAVFGVVRERRLSENSTANRDRIEQLELNNAGLQQGMDTMSSIIEDGIAQGADLPDPAAVVASIPNAELGASTDSTPVEDGRDGTDGATGDSGPPGAVGEDGRGIADVDVDDTGCTLLVQFTDGTSSSLGPICGADGATGDSGPPGANGANGADGLPGANGADGAAGPAGRGVATVAVIDGCTLAVTYTDGAAESFGPICGADGADGVPGADAREVIAIECDALTAHPNEPVTPQCRPVYG